MPDPTSKAAPVARAGVNTLSTVVVDFTVAMDRFMESFSGPYQVNGTTVSARPHFRMAGPQGQPLNAARLAKLDGYAAKANVSSWDVTSTHLGRPTPSQIKKVAQCLIDALLASSDTAYALTTTDGIRLMMFDYGVGIDCAGYVQQAFLATRGRTRADFGLAPKLADEGLGSLSSSKFRKFDLKSARSGDFIILSPPAPHDVGHTLLVYSHVVEPTEVQLAQAHGADAAALTTGADSGPAHLYYLDASWGAHGVATNLGAGVQRKPWTYNEATGIWRWFEVDGVLEFGDRPFNHPPNGAFRPRWESR